jgi:hypothetical protein
MNQKDLNSIKKLAEIYSDKKTKQLRIIPLLKCAYEIGKQNRKLTNIYEKK